MGKISHSRRYSAQPQKAYDQQEMEDCYRQSSDKIQRYTATVEAALEGQGPSWTSLRSAMQHALKSEFPKKKGQQDHRDLGAAQGSPSNP